MTDWIRQMVNGMGYLGLGLLTFLENIFPPLPSEVILPLGGYMVAQGNLALLGVILAGTAGSMAGAVVLYYVGRYFNEERLKAWVDRNGRWLLVTRGDVDSAFAWFDKHGGKTVFVCRLIPGVRSLISIPAGACGMPMGSFLLYSTLGTALWSAILTYAGLRLGNRYSDVGNFLQWVTYATVALVILSIVWWVIQKKREQRQ